MARYYVTNPGQFAKTHMMTGHNDVHVTNCGLVFRRGSKEFRALRRVRALPIGKTRKGNHIWDMTPVTCSHCHRLGIPDFFDERKKKDVGPDAGRPDSSEHGPRGTRPPERGW